MGFKQCVTVPEMLNDTDTDTFFRYQIFSIPIPVLFRYQIFSDTGFETFFRYQILPIPVPRLFLVPNLSDTGSELFLVPNFSDTGSETFFRYQFVPIPVPIPPTKWKIPGTGNSRYRYVTLWHRPLARNLFPNCTVNIMDTKQFKKVQGISYKESVNAESHTGHSQKPFHKFHLQCHGYQAVLTGAGYLIPPWRRKNISGEPHTNHSDTMQQ